MTLFFFQSFCTKKWPNFFFNLFALKSKKTLGPVPLILIILNLSFHPSVFHLSVCWKNQKSLKMKIKYTPIWYKITKFSIFVNSQKYQAFSRRSISLKNFNKYAFSSLKHDYKATKCTVLTSYPGLRLRLCGYCGCGCGCGCG